MAALENASNLGASVYGRFALRKARVRCWGKFLGVVHFLRNSGFARPCGLRDLHVLPDAGEPRCGLPHEEVGGTSTGDVTARWLPAAWEA